MLLALAALIIANAVAPINGDFEKGDFTGWEADPNWVVVDNSCGYYSGWEGKYWAWSGGKGETATGVLKSKPFTLNKDGVSLLISGWNSMEGSGNPRKWNYVSLNLADGTELDRVYAPNTTTFVRAFLDGAKHKGEKVFVKAVNDADQTTYSMLCLDDVRTADLAADLKASVPALPTFDAKKSLGLENAGYRVEVDRTTGSLRRLRDKVGGLELILEPRLAGSWRFALPIPGKEPWQTLEANWIIGLEQKLTTCRLEGSTLTLTWKGPLKNYLGETYDVDVTQTIQLVADGVRFDLSIDNRTKLPIGEVYHPVFGGMLGLGRTRGQLKATELIRPTASGGFASTDIFRVFNNFNWLGDHGPEQFYGILQDQPTPWIGFSCPRVGRAVLIGARSTDPQRLVARLELVPSGTGTPREDGSWPRPSELHGMPCGVEFNFVDLAGLPPGQTYHAAPVFVRFVKGGEHEIQKAYESWVAGG